VAVAPNGEVYVTDGHGRNDRVVKFSKEGKFIKAWGHHGFGPGEFDQPHDIALDSTGRVFVADRTNNRVQIFDADGNFIAQWKQFGRPSAVYVSRDDKLYVSDSYSNQKINPGFKRGIYIGSAITGEVAAFIPDPDLDRQEALNITGASGIAADEEGTVYAADVGPQRLRKYVKEPAKEAADPHMTFFITSVGLGDGGNLGGIVGADRHCQDLATAVGAGNRSWRAYLSAHAESSGNATAGTDAVARAAAGGTQAAFARFRVGDGPWVNSKGVRVARDITDLHGDTPELARAGNNLTRATALNEKGQEIKTNEHSILTGTRANGTPYSTGDNLTCGNWKSNSAGRAQIGLADRMGDGSTSWNSATATTGCSQSDLAKAGSGGLFYCFAQD
jgi:hypothetical protein